jgi:hypothetical protein
MFDPSESFPPDLLSPRQRLRTPARWSTPPDGSGHQRGRGQAGLRRLSVLEQLAAYIRELLPWLSRDTGQPVGMWVEETGFVTSPFEPHPVGTPYLWISVASWEAAEAVYEALHSKARIDDAMWIGGWFRTERGLRKIKIYPELPQTRTAE